MNGYATVEIPLRDRVKKTLKVLALTLLVAGQLAAALQENQQSAPYIRWAVPPVLVAGGIFALRSLFTTRAKVSAEEAERLAQSKAQEEEEAAE